jgi:hypothetical protein
VEGTCLSVAAVELVGGACPFADCNRRLGAYCSVSAFVADAVVGALVVVWQLRMRRVTILVRLEAVRLAVRVVVLLMRRKHLPQTGPAKDSH